MVSSACRYPLPGSLPTRWKSFGQPTSSSMWVGTPLMPKVPEMCHDCAKPNAVSMSFTCFSTSTLLDSFFEQQVTNNANSTARQTKECFRVILRAAKTIDRYWKDDYIGNEGP